MCDLVERPLQLGEYHSDIVIHKEFVYLANYAMIRLDSERASKKQMIHSAML